jgi:hypothetical protein
VRCGESLVFRVLALVCLLILAGFGGLKARFLARRNVDKLW